MRIIWDATLSQECVLKLLDYINSCKGIQGDCNAIKDEASENAFVPGDVTADGKVTIRDAAQIIQFVLNHESYDPKDPTHAAADINGNTKFDIADVQKVILKALGRDGAALIARLPQGRTDCSLTVESVDSHSASSMFAIGVNSNFSLTGGQLDIVLPEGAEIESIQATGRLEGLDFYTNDLGNGVTTVVFIDLEGEKEIADLNGAVVMVKTTGKSISVENAYFTNAGGQLLAPSNGAVSGITTVWQDVKSAGHKIYNVAGQALGRMTRGVNIIRNADGSTDKVMNK